MSESLEVRSGDAPLLSKIVRARPRSDGEYDDYSTPRRNLGKRNELTVDGSSWRHGIVGIDQTISIISAFNAGRASNAVHKWTGVRLGHIRSPQSIRLSSKHRPLLVRASSSVAANGYTIPGVHNVRKHCVDTATTEPPQRFFTAQAVFISGGWRGGGFMPTPKEICLQYIFRVHFSLGDITLPYPGRINEPNSPRTCSDASSNAFSSNTFFLFMAFHFRYDIFNNNNVMWKSTNTINSFTIKINRNSSFYIIHHVIKFVALEKVPPGRKFSPL